MFTDDEISWLGDCFSPKDISGLRRPKNVKFGTMVASSTRMMHAVRFFLEKVYLIVSKCAKKTPNMSNFFSM